MSNRQIFFVCKKSIKCLYNVHIITNKTRQRNHFIFKMNLHTYMYSLWSFIFLRIPLWYIYHSNILLLQGEALIDGTYTTLISSFYKTRQLQMVHIPLKYPPSTRRGTHRWYIYHSNILLLQDEALKDPFKIILSSGVDRFFA